MNQISQVPRIIKAYLYSLSHTSGTICLPLDLKRGRVFIKLAKDMQLGEDNLTSNDKAIIKGYSVRTYSLDFSIHSRTCERAFEKSSCLKTGQFCDCCLKLFLTVHMTWLRMNSGPILYKDFFVKPSTMLSPLTIGCQ